MYSVYYIQTDDPSRMIRVPNPMCIEDRDEHEITVVDAGSRVPSIICPLAHDARRDVNAVAAAAGLTALCDDLAAVRMIRDES